MKDRPPFGAAEFLVKVTTVGELLFAVALIFANIPEQNQTAFVALVSAWTTAWIGINTYHFGSSSGSAHKTTILDKISGTGDGGTSTTTASIKTDVTHVSNEPAKE